jgi:uncharacterized membrane protein
MACPLVRGARFADPLRHELPALTKYPPSLLYVMATLGVRSLLLALFDRVDDTRVIGWLAVFGGAPMFFYLLHPYILRMMYLGAVAIGHQ